MNKIYIVSDAFTAEELFAELNTALSNVSDLKLELEKQPKNVMSAEVYQVVIQFFGIIGGSTVFATLIKEISAVHQKKLDNAAKEKEQQHNLEVLKVEKAHELEVLKVKDAHESETLKLKYAHESETLKLKYAHDLALLEDKKQHIVTDKQENERKLAATVVRLKFEDGYYEDIELNKLQERLKLIEVEKLKSIALITNP
jgi:hypothetical protein